MGEQQQKSSFCARLCKKDKRRFMKYIESTTTHGVVRIFTGKSRIRRVFWLLVVLVAVSVCLNNIIERGLYLSSQPTATTLSRVRRDNLTFPAVTICNLNQVRRSQLAQLGENIVPVVDFFQSNLQLVCNDSDFTTSGAGLVEELRAIDANISFRDILYLARHRQDTLIEKCVFAGQECSPSDFQPVLTRLGYCYVFNSNVSRPRTTLGTGVRHGLSLVLNIEQDEYIINDGRDAGVKIAIHGQEEPAEPDENGLGVAPGNNAFISLRKRMVRDNSVNRRSGCREAGDTQQFNFLNDQFHYSTPACLIDCFYTNITEECGCIEANVEYPPQSSRFNNIRNCSTDDLCCVVDLYVRPQVCDCPAACNYADFETQISYSAFPGERTAQLLASTFQQPVQYFSDNFLSVNVYYETLNVELEVTANSYSPVAFLSDVGGQLGLLIGASVISVLEFVTWVLDECKDRCVGISDKKIEEWSEEIEQEMAAAAERAKEEEEKRKIKDLQSNSHNHTQVVDSGPL